MKKEELNNIEEYLYSEGYKKYTESAKHTQSDTYEWIKSFNDDNGQLKYQIVYRVLDFTKYTSEANLNNPYSIDVVILTEHNDRTDLNTRLFNLQDVERFAERYYMFLNNSLLPKEDN